MIRWLIVALVWLAAAPASGHEFRPTLLRFDVAGDGAHQIVWKWDGLDPRGISGDELAFEGCEADRVDTSIGDERMTRISLTCPDADLTIGLPRPVAEIVIDARFDGRPTEIRRVRAAVDSIDASEFRRAASDETEAPTVSIAEWITLGVEHILLGWDHLAFVLALTLLVARLRRVLLVVTGFTLGHSLTLGLTSLGLIPPPSSAPVEATIALSIAYLAVELTRNKEAREQFARRHGPGIAAAFGLIHGFGFAGVLQELSLPAGGEWRALLGFNLGVEIGQLAFVAVVLAALRLGRALVATDEPVPGPVRWGAAYGLGSLGILWTLQRSGQILGF